MAETDLDDDVVLDTAGEYESVRLIREAIELIMSAKALPLSSSVRIEPEEVLRLLDAAVDRLPGELREARWLLKERDEFLAKVELEGDQIVDEARTRAEKLVARQEIVRQAKLTAQKLVTEAEDAARKEKRATEDWCDQHLARFEIVLDRTMKTVAAGREKLRSVPTTSRTFDTSEPMDDDDAVNAFFDQDLT